MTTPITIVGNLTSDPELRFTGNGTAVASFHVAVNERKKVGDQWEDDGATFYRCSAWRNLAEHCAESLVKGTRVIIQGELRSRSYTKDNVERINLDVEVRNIGPDLNFATAKVNRVQRSSSNNSANAGGAASAPAAASAPIDDPWATPAGGADEAPF